MNLPCVEAFVMMLCPLLRHRLGRADYLCCFAGFEAESEEEVTVSPGDEIIVHVEVEGWFQITRVADQTRGLVPASYVQVN